MSDLFNDFSNVYVCVRVFFLILYLHTERDEIKHRKKKSYALGEEKSRQESLSSQVKQFYFSYVFILMGDF